MDIDQKTHPGSLERVVRRILCLATDHKFDETAMDHGYLDCRRCGLQGNIVDKTWTLGWQLWRLKKKPRFWLMKLKCRWERRKGADDVPF